MTHPPHAILRILLPICLLMTAAPALGAEGVKQERPFEFSVGKGLSLGSNSMIGGLSMASRIGTRFGNIHPYIGLEHLKVQVSADGENYSGGLTVVGPGARMMLSEPGKDSTVAYIPAQILVLIPSTNTGEDELDNIPNNASNWGVQVGFGAEHFIANTFSLSGEVGGRYHAVSYSDEGFDLKGNLAMTYAGASLNFYL